jgi:Ca2+-binding EF-hand superfamily protein
LKEINDRLSYPDFLTIVHEYWYPIEDDRRNLEEAFDVLDPKRTAKLTIEDFSSLLRNSDWPEEEIELILSQISCGDGYFLYDGKNLFLDNNLRLLFFAIDLTKLLLTPVELPKKKSAKPKSSGKKKSA